MAYPAAIPVFTDLIDDVDFILAADQNDPNDVITSIATMIGAVGAAQSYSADILDFLSNMQAPILTKASGTTLSVAAGSIVIKNAAQSKRYLKKNTGAVTITAANIDTGSLADDTYYYVYAIGDAAATTFTIVFSTSASAPNVAAGLVYELIGWFFNEAAGSIDITSGFVGNVKKNGRDVPNAVWKSSAVDFTTLSTSMVDDTEAGPIRFYSSGRPVRIYYNLGIGFSGADIAKALISIDAAEQSSSERWQNGSATNPQKILLNCEIITTLAAGVHTIQGRVKTESGQTLHVAVREIGIVEI